jgi:hypothetical protein
VNTPLAPEPAFGWTALMITVWPICRLCAGDVIAIGLDSLTPVIRLVVASV